jgi:sodium-dependent dicarboxylate transporter 2/3/5
MRRTDQAAGVAQMFSPAEERFHRRRRAIGLVGGVVVFAAVLLTPMPGVPPEAHRLAAALALMVVFWVTEALPLAVTALLGPLLVVVMGVAPARAAFAPFADPIIFLFIGSFILAEAMFVHGLERRLAYTALGSRWVGKSALRLAVVYALVGATLSMWMSNTATTAMLFPLGLAVLAELGRTRQQDAAFRQYSLVLMLVTAFAPSIGGMGTPVGTPPNLIGVGLLRQVAGIDINFVGWMMLGVPVVFCTMVGLIVFLLVPHARHLRLTPEAVDAIQTELARLGPVTRGERNVLTAFAVTIVLWVLPGVLQAALGPSDPLVQRLSAVIPESVAALIGAILLFLLPLDWRARRFTMTWDQAVRIDWGIVLLFGGGLAMGQLAESTGLSRALGSWVAAGLPGAGTTMLTVAFTAIGVLMSEAASNTASANIVVPMAIAVARAAGVSPLEPALGATLGASMGFMMPISTPPNAIIYSSGYVPIGAMIRHGVILDLMGFVVIVALVLGLGQLLQ